jgi:hypothetical protein
MVFCANCGLENYEILRFCPNFGSPNNKDKINLEIESNNLYIQLAHKLAIMGSISTPQHKKMVTIAVAVLSTVLLTSTVASSFEMANADRISDAKQKVKDKVNKVLKKIKDRLSGSGGGSDGGGGTGD